MVAANIPPPLMSFPPIAMLPDIVPPARARSSDACPVTFPAIVTPEIVPPVIATALAFCVDIVPKPAANPRLVPGSL
mgnify:CR=1 FL=1